MSSRRSVAGWLTVVFVAGQLGILAIKELREQGSPLVEQYAVFGYAPNLIAALTLPWLVLALAVKRIGQADDAYAWRCLWHERRAITAALLLPTAGLLAWEFLQPFRPNRTFDWLDVWATLAGAGLWLAIVLLARGISGRQVNSSPPTRA
ncbi:hypothetical protein [Stenotrophomonas sp. SY1]|uniref:hypothetical protein n=1 Tax=Stenotrophomonas sp. SY1 TaxID=477235 RepID=UPI001E433958|nr:hypothetical protein [Stenotrophomonas sp. SY1]MCD9087567.1 hypothetical protein [Stenotrophomonas sp. SY1]